MVVTLVRPRALLGVWVLEREVVIEGHAARRQYAHRFCKWNVAQALGHHQVDEVVDVRQPPTVELVDRYFAVQSQLVNVLSRFGYVRRVCVEAVYEETIIRQQGTRQLPVAATEVNDQAAGDAGFFEDLLSGGIHRLGRHGARRCKRHESDGE